MQNKNLGRTAVRAMAAAALTFTYAASAANIGYVVGTDNNGQSFDGGWISRLTNTLGHTVTQFPENTLATDPVLATMNLLIVSSDVGSGGFLSGVGLNRPQPIISFEYGIYDEIFGASNGTTGGAANNITILDATSPLAAGLSGDVSVYTGGGGGSRFTLAAVTAGTDVIASSVSNPTYGVFAVLEPGEIGGGGSTWSARRMAVPAYADWDPALVTADGWKLLDGAVAYGLVPEPSSFVLLGLGMALFLARRQRR